MSYSLEFNPNRYTVHTLSLDGVTVTYRAYENIVYVANPVDTAYQQMNIYAPEAYFEGKSIGPYSLETAPIFMPNTVGGYMPGTPEIPGRSKFGGHPNAAFTALSKGLVVAAPGARGRKLQNAEGQFTGTAPACIVDLKAAVRYLRHNKKRIPGDTGKIISNGTSAGGALSSLLGATGNHADYEPYLKALGAAQERDDIFAASCYCPITNLEHADAAYEWMFNGILEYHKMIRTIDGDQVTFTPFQGTMTDEQAKLSDAVKETFPAYLNGLGLQAPDGTRLHLDAQGEGPFKELVTAYLAASAQQALADGTDLSEHAWITLDQGTVTHIDWNRFVPFATRMKPALAFDSAELGTPENELFGTSTIERQHFTAFSREHSKQNGSLADPSVVKMLNPMNYIGGKDNVTAAYWRIRHGAVDRDTSLAIPVILATKLENTGARVDFALPWGRGHAGDYDLEELFAWIESISVLTGTKSN